MDGPDGGNPPPLASDDGPKLVSPGSENFAKLTPASLADQHWQLELPTEAEMEKLRALGIDDAALWQPWPLRVANVKFNGHLFDFAADGQRPFILRADDADYCADLLAWRGDKIASLYGAAFCLGDRDQIHNPATFFGKGTLRIHRTAPGRSRRHRDLAARVGLRRIAERPGVRGHGRPASSRTYSLVRATEIAGAVFSRRSPRR